MPRLARTVFGWVPHHITQRGNRRGDVFFTVDDRKTYLGWLSEYAKKHQVEVLAYCLMTNHIHLVAAPETEEGLRGMLEGGKCSVPFYCFYSDIVSRRGLLNWISRINANNTPNLTTLPIATGVRLT